MEAVTPYYPLYYYHQDLEAVTPYFSKTTSRERKWVDAVRSKAVVAQVLAGDLESHDHQLLLAK